MSIIEWGPERKCTGEQPCPDWVIVHVNEPVSGWRLLVAKYADWNRVDHYRLPAEYEALIAARKPTHEQMREELAARYEDMPDDLVEIDPVKAAYQASGKVRGCEWEYLEDEWQDVFRAAFKAGQEYQSEQYDKEGLEL